MYIVKLLHSMILIIGVGVSFSSDPTVTPLVAEDRVGTYADLESSDPWQARMRI